jgi:flagellar hook-length control protein FliK
VFPLNASTVSGAATDTATPPTLQLHAGVDSGEFAQDLSDRVTYLVGNGMNGARLQVNPPQLGPIELRIAVSGDHAQVWMTTHSAVTRDALESSSPKLREMLGAQGFGAVSVNISQRSFQDRSGQAQPYQRTASAERSGVAPLTAGANPSAGSRAPAGGLDAYA